MCVEERNFAVFFVVIQKIFVLQVRSKSSLSLGLEEICTCHKRDTFLKVEKCTADTLAFVRTPQPVQKIVRSMHLVFSFCFV